MNPLVHALVASIPSPSSGSISIGPFDLRAYGLMIALGVIAGVWLLGRCFEQKGVGTSDDASAIAVWGVVAGIIGSRLYHVATEWPRFEDDLGAIPKIWEGGLGIPGGLLAGVGVGLWQANRRGEYLRANSATVVTNSAGRFRFEGPRPVSYAGRPPHIHLRVVAREHELLFTRYVPKPRARSGSVRLVLVPQRL